MKTYRYVGAQAYPATIDGKDIFFEKNKDLELPSENIYIRSMVEAELLVEQQQPAEPAKTSKSNKRTK